MSGFGSKSEMSSNKRSPYFYDPLDRLLVGIFLLGFFPRVIALFAQIHCVYLLGGSQT